MECPDSTPITRYNDLYNEFDLNIFLNRSIRYVEACNELSFFFKHAYSRFPKPMQSLLFDEVLSAFRLLPEIKSQKAMEVANILLNRAEYALPKQKKVLAGKEFRHAMVACKRRSKTRQNKEGLPSLPVDALIHIFSFLDLRSLATVALVCRLWSVTASENCIWKPLYSRFFNDPENGMRMDELKSGGMLKYEKDVDSQMNTIYWRNNFKRAYNGILKKNYTPYRGYCRRCDLIVWIDDARCYNRHNKGNCQKPLFPVSLSQILDYVLIGGTAIFESSSESDSDDDYIFKTRSFWKDSDLIL